MGGSVTRPKAQYTPSGSGLSQYSSYPPVGQYSPGIGNSPPLNKKQQKQLNEAYRTIQNFQSRMPAMQRGPGVGSSLPTYGGPPIMNVSQPSPTLQRAYGQYPNPVSSHYPMGAGSYRDTDYAAVANIAGMNPADVALLHREYVSLTRGGTNKLDRVVFRQLLRDILIDANNENIDRALENIFVSIDRNHDGFIDFPEFIGAFRDLLRTDPNNSQNNLIQNLLPDLLNEQSRGNMFGNSGTVQPITLLQQAQPTPQIISMPSYGVQQQQQQPLVYNGSTPLVLSLDSNQSPYVVNSSMQPIMAQPTALQCVSLPM